MKSPYYFNLWGDIGPETAKYHSLADLLKTMDELGIWQTTASYQEQNAMMARNRLLEMIEETPGAAERVVPCFELQPYPFISAHEMESLQECLRDHRPACLRIRPKSYGFRVRELEWVIEKLEEQAPVLFVTVNELDLGRDLDDMELLARRFPQIKIVIQQVMWSPIHYIYDAMKRCPNLYIDNAWLHTRDNLRMMVRDFGDARVLFSLGLRGNRGAAMGGLAWDQFSQAEKDRIAWDNAVALFPEKDRKVLKARRRSVESTLKNRFWKPFLKGEPIRDILVVDAHTHITPHNHRWMTATNVETEERDAMLFDMDRLGIDMVVGTDTYRCPDNPLKPQYDVLKVTEGYRDRFAGYLNYRSMFPEVYTEKVMDELFESGYFVGLKTLPSYEKIPIDDPRYGLMFAYAEKHRLPILIHTWDDAEGAGTALRCGNAAKKYPHTRVILGHSGGGDTGRHECEMMAQDPAYDNVFFEFCGSFTAGMTWEESLRKIDYHRVLFGTDTHNHDVPWEMGRLLSENIPDEALEAILGANAIRVLGLGLKEKRAKCAM